MFSFLLDPFRIFARIEAKVDQAIGLLNQVLVLLRPKPESLVLKFGPVSSKVTPKGETRMQVLADEQKVSVSLEPKTQAGNPARVDGIPTWEVSDANILDLVVSPDGLNAVVTAKGPLGKSQISVKADADLGEGLREITTIDEVEVVAAEAVTLGLKFGTPETK